MRFKKPDGGIAWLSGLWMLVGGFVAVNEFLRGGETFFMVGGAILFISGLLVWLDVRQIAWPLMIWFAFVVLCGIVVLVFKAFTVKTSVAVFMAGYSVYELNQWRTSD